MGDPVSGRQLGGSGCISSWTPGSGLTWGLVGMLDNRRMARWPGETPTPERGTSGQEVYPGRTGV